MTSNNFIKIKRPTKPTAQSQPQASSQVEEQLQVEPTQPIEIEQPEQPAPPVKLESLAEGTKDQSVCGSGWSITELLNEFSGR